MLRRDLIKSSIFSPLAFATATLANQTNSDGKFPPIRQITKGPKYHWFGYYDKLQFSTDHKLVLCNQSTFENRSPGPDDEIAVGMIDISKKDEWIELGKSRAWCWQQGCMLQWLPGSDREVIWNDRDGDHYVCHILDIHSGRKRTIPHPIYALSPDGSWGIAPSFSRLADMRPGYGYAGVPDRFTNDLAPEEVGIFRIDLKTGEQKLLISLADVVKKFPFQSKNPARDKHWFNHLLVNQDGSRFVFLHRWRPPETGHLTHMISASPDGSDYRVLIGSGAVSHFIWRDSKSILAYAKPRENMNWGFFVFQDSPELQYEEIGKGILTSDGHCTYLPGNRWILNDTYRDKNKIQHPHLFDTQTSKRVELGEMLLPDPYVTGSRFNEWRVDLHPRFSRDGRLVTIDSPYTGQGRQLHLIDISKIVT
jgi:hypothetical protein